MARGGKRGGRGRGRGGNRGGDRRGGEDNRVSFDKVEKNNPKLQGYYDEVLGIPEKEREEFWAAYKRELPNSFRFTGSKGHALTVQKKLKERYVPEISKISHWDGQKVDPPVPVEWYPDELAWWMTTPKNVVRKFAPFAAFQKFLVSETSVGNISRQEVVSMIPPLVMDLKPGMTVLDMCAAPGSKAAQLLEMVHRGEEARVHKSLRDYAETDGRKTSPGPTSSAEDDEAFELDPTDNGRATGLLIANDSDYKRSHMLIHQLKRLSSPNLIVTNHDATMYPSIKLPATPENPAFNRYLKFDRILADVPCSGDGTMRKNVNLWKDWTPGNAIGLHQTQVRILVRSLQMLKAGGRVVYSTCSMNPVENEAVVASAIERCGGLEKVHVVPTSDQLPLLKRYTGLKHWKVMDKAGKVWSSFEEVEEYNAKNGATAATEKLSPGMFTPMVSSPEFAIPFDRCMRVYAHSQDTGGFFITILEKRTEFKAKPESEQKKGEPKPPISAIVDEIESMPPPKEGESVAPKIEAADALDGVFTAPDEVAPVARQNQENPETSATVNSNKRSADDEVEIDGVMSTKKLKSRQEGDEAAEPGLEDRQVHYPPPPGANLDATIRPGDMRDGIVAPQARRNKDHAQQFEEPFKYISGEHPEVKSIEEFYHLSPRFPRDRFMVRNASGEPAKTIYYTSALIRDILTENEGKGIKFIHGGVRMFMKQDVQGDGVCKWRIQSEGMPILEGYVGEERVVRLYKKSTLKKLLIEMFPKVADGGWKNLGEIGEHVNNIGMGCCVLRIEPSDDPDGFSERMVLPLWRSLHSLNLMLAKEDRSAMLLRIFNDTTPLVNNSNTSKQGKQPAPGFKIEDGEVHVDVNPSIAAAAPVGDDASEQAAEAVVKPGPYDTIVAAPKTGNELDVKAERIDKGEDTSGHEIEGQLGAPA
ncbi:S-adenosyl-L-methionine-dependent methyltransferase [Glarea lozoyensis ATCC 20868]|uniref:S-adenosyl-L-methionine-dependent methyltransferase n=1 Tax=Glarea lozoyensis (strain ATCC 20868 / MF5171) TaxID=1116229 RepID=S3DGG9_GLAL2|nr:S-adenosyl-L-methionine-dependent methyltransferase [Glarea lozoyensis ATCC 20868]EPE31126.1 S-adenosyl-L-methionine-dependent methyltransferase [Glarea lozoyensis ATCC 20868]